MSRRGPLIMALLASVSASPVSAQQPDDSREIPASYLACASNYWRSLLRNGDAAGRFDCTNRYLEILPDHAGGTLQMRETRTQAILVADRYVEDVVAAGLAERLKTEVDARGDYVMAKSRLLDAAVGAARLYDETLCDLVEEAFGAGTFRYVASANCRIRNRDRLIEDLLRARIDIMQEMADNPPGPGPRPSEQ